MLANTNLISCNFTCLSLKHRRPKVTPISENSTLLPNPKFLTLHRRTPSIETVKFDSLTKKTVGFRCYSVLDSQDSEKETEQVLMQGVDKNEEGRDWTTSILLFVFWGGLIYYVFNLSPDQTPSMDSYLLQKLLNLKGDDGFKMNGVLVSLWYLMGLWPLVYSMLLIPTARSSKSKIPVWPFVVLSFFGGAYALIPYFVLWKPPPPPVKENELARWPLNFLETKFTAGVSLAAGLGLMVYAGAANADVWKEFFQYFRESKFIHVMTIDFALLSSFASFWVYNDMTARKWYDKGSWLLPVALIPFLGPSLYLLLRPALSTIQDADEQS